MADVPATMRRAPREMAARLPQAPGVYRFRNAAGQVLYLGRAASLRPRVMSYWRDLRGREHLAPMIARIAAVEAAVCDSAHEAAWLERNLLRADTPPWNRAPDGGQESEVWIGVSGSARAPGLRVTHQPGRGGWSFGPYLGGRRARLAVSGLSRLFPVEYAADEPAGTMREIARLRSVSAAGRAGLTAAVRAILEREDAAITAAVDALTARRDAAASTLSFELAARLQSEIEALAWITAAQKVTRPSSLSAGVHGWAGGVLTTFAIREGRVTAWSQRSCDSAAARPLLAATPPEWREFARRNAALAALLAR